MTIAFWILCAVFWAALILSCLPRFRANPAALEVVETVALAGIAVVEFTTGDWVIGFMSAALVLAVVAFAVMRRRTAGAGVAR